MSSTPPQPAIQVVKASTHNLQEVSLTIPHRQLIVVTGLSGSGKSSLAFHTLFVESLRSYTESFSPYVRQFLGKIPQPPVEAIHGILPSVGMKQQAPSYNPAARVSTTADLYPYLKLLYARIGKTYSPISGQEVTKDDLRTVTTYLHTLPADSKVFLLAPLHRTPDRTLQETLAIELAKGFSRVSYQGHTHYIEDLLATTSSPDIPEQANLHLVVDRLILKPGDTAQVTQLADTLETTFFEGQGTCVIHVAGQAPRTFSDRFERDGITFTPPSEDFFNFNSPHGACPTCGGYGRCMGINRDKVIPNPTLTLAQDAIAPWSTPAMRSWYRALFQECPTLPLHTPYQKLTQQEQAYIWKGDQAFGGLEGFFDMLASKPHKMQYRILLSRYRGYTDCHDCKATGLRSDTQHVKIQGKSLVDLLRTPIQDLVPFFDNLTLTPTQQELTKVILEAIQERLHYLLHVGLSYLTLHRPTHTLSGGEYQRIRLARALGSNLTDTLYCLDEPTIGLHPRDTQKLIQVLLSLKQGGNTLIVVEHEEALMRVADQIIDIGPQAGRQGGNIVFQGTWDDLLHAQGSHTAHYLTGKATIPLPPPRPTPTHWLSLLGARHHNLQSVDLHLPLECFTVVTGVSGSGKSTLVKELLYPALANYLGHAISMQGTFTQLAGDFQRVAHIELISQSPLGRSTRSNPATYTKAYDPIRKLFAQQPLAQERRYTPSFFSFNTEGGRCDECLGDGTNKVEMQFMADIHITCPSCQGQRFKQEALEVTWKGKHIHHVLGMTVDQALTFFATKRTITNKLQPLQDVGLGYLQLGQSSSTLSGGEAQRLKLSTYLGKEQHPTPTLFLFDEPTTGLHFHDIYKLLQAFQRLVAQGHTLLVIEHNLDVIKTADWVIDLGPEGGDKGGHITFAGTPTQMVHTDKGHTATYLRTKLPPAQTPHNTTVNKG